MIDAIQVAGTYRVVGCTGEAKASKEVLGVPVLGTDEILPRLRAEGIDCAAIGVGANGLRLRLASQATKMGFSLPIVAHPSAQISSTAQIADGCVILAGSAINANASLGECCIINTLAGVDHDCDLGAGTHVGPGATLAGNVVCGHSVFFGAGSTTIPQVIIGDNCTIGAGSVVISDIPSGATFVGVPAKPMRRSIK